MIYVDSSAVVKLVRREAHTAELAEWLNARPGAPLVSSALVEVEVSRALRRVAPDALAAVPAVLARLYRVEIDAPIRAAAAAFEQPELRTLDAIHLATADAVGGELETFVSYDQRLLQGADARGLSTASPGAVAADS